MYLSEYVIMYPVKLVHILTNASEISFAAEDLQTTFKNKIKYFREMW